MNEMKEQIAKAMIERFKSVIAEAAGESFEQTKVGLPGMQIWEGYAAAALSAIDTAGYVVVPMADLQRMADHHPETLGLYHGQNFKLLAESAAGCAKLMIDEAMR